MASIAPPRVNADCALRPADAMETMDEVAKTVGTTTAVDCMVPCIAAAWRGVGSAAAEADETCSWKSRWLLISCCAQLDGMSVNPQTGQQTHTQHVCGCMRMGGACMLAPLYVGSLIELSL